MADITYTKTTWANSPSTTTPLSAANLQNAEDVLYQVVHKASRTGILQADQVPDYGIGAYPTLKSGISLNTLKIPGNYSCDGTCTGKPSAVPAGYGVTVRVVAYTSPYIRQICEWAEGNARLPKYIRECYENTWGSWYQEYNSSTDGNGGQPPAPKPTLDAVPGQKYPTDYASGASVVAPSSGSTWYWEVETYGAYVGSAGSGVAAAGATVGTASANLRLNWWRKS